jgi:hypothetical protein
MTLSLSITLYDTDKLITYQVHSHHRYCVCIVCLIHSNENVCNVIQSMVLLNFNISRFNPLTFEVIAIYHNNIITYYYIYNN